MQFTFQVQSKLIILLLNKPGREIKHSKFSSVLSRVNYNLQIFENLICMS